MDFAHDKTSTQGISLSALERWTEGENPEMGSWAVPWSDLMMVMFILFVVLFAFMARERAVPELFSSQEKGLPARLALAPTGGLTAETVPTLRVDLSGVAETLMERARSQPHSPFLNVRLVSSGPEPGVLVQLDATRLFASGSSQLDTAELERLEPLVNTLAATQTEVYVTGHADAASFYGSTELLPEHLKNSPLALSALRAATLADYLTGRMPDAEAASARFTIRGRGASAPTLPGDDPRARRASQRVDILLTTTSS